MSSELNIFKAFSFSQIDQKTAVSIKVSDPTISKIELRDFEKLESLDLTEINQNILLTIENCPKLSFVNLPFIQEEHQIEYKCRSSSEKDEYQCMIRGKMISFLFQMIDQEKEKILVEEMICATNEKPLNHVLIGNADFLKKIHESCHDFSIYCLQIYKAQEEQTYQLALKSPFLMLISDYEHLLFLNQIDMMSLYLNNCQTITYYEMCPLVKINGNQSVSMIDYQLKNTEIINQIQDKQDSYQMLLKAEIEKKREYDFTQQQINLIKQKDMMSSKNRGHHTNTSNQLISKKYATQLKKSFKTISEVEISILNEKKYEIRSKMKFLNLFQKIEFINCQLDQLEIKSNFIPVKINLFNTSINGIKSQFLKSAYADETSKILSFDLNQTDINFSYHVDQKKPTLVDLKGSLFENHQKYLSRYHVYFDLNQDDDMSQMLQLFDQMTEDQKLNHLYSIGHTTENSIEHFKNLKFLYMLVKKDPYTYAENIWAARIRAMNHLQNGENKEIWMWLVPKEYHAEAYLVDLHLVLRLYHIYPPAKAWFDQYLYSFVLPIQISTLIEILLPIEQEDGCSSIFEPLEVDSQALYYEIFNHIFYILENAKIQTKFSNFSYQIDQGELISDGKIDDLYLAIYPSNIMKIIEIDPKYELKKKSQLKSTSTNHNSLHPPFEVNLNLIANQIATDKRKISETEMEQNEAYESLLAYTRQRQYRLGDFQKDLYHMIFNLYDLVCELKLNHPRIQKKTSTFLARLEKGLVDYLLQWPLDVNMFRNGPLELLHTLGSKHLDQMLWEIFNMSSDEFEDYHRNELRYQSHLYKQNHSPELHNLRKELILELHIKPTQNLFFNQNL